MTSTNRRQVLKGGAAALCLGAAPFVVPRRAHAATTISLISFGGSAGEAQRKVWIEPFTAETGIAVAYVTGPDLAKVKAQVETNNVSWDVVEAFGLEAAKAGLAEPIDYTIIDPARFMVKPPSHAVRIGGIVGGFAYDPKRTPNPPKDFSQFLDVRKFPGRRALRNRATEMIELALVGDGVAPANLYPLDVERAFKALDRIKPHVKKWFAETAQGVSLIQTNEVEYTYTYLNRVLSAKQSGVSIEMSLAQNIIQAQYSFVPKGSPRKEPAMRFLEFITRPKVQAAAITELRGTYPAVKGIERFVDPAVLQTLPALDNPTNIFFNGEYWADHFLDIDRRFKEWTLT